MFALFVALAGCAGNNVPVSEQAVPLPSAVVSMQTDQLTPDEMGQVVGKSETGAYMLGPNDVISVNVYSHPDLSVPNPLQYGNSGGALITSDGTVQLPLVGNVELGGLSLTQAQQKLQTTYAVYVVNPQIAVELQAPQSMRYYLLGAFTSPGVKYPNHPLHLLDALALGGSVDISSADLYQAYVAQNSVKLPVDLHALLVNGDMSQNITLASGDAIVIPTSSNENAFVFGSVGKPGSVSFQSGQLSLLQALADAGLDLTAMTNGKLSEVRVIRSEGAHGEFFVVNVAMIANGKAASFPLQPGDIVYVPASGIGTLNQAVNALLPSLQAVSAILNPFVDIKYLRQSN
jgi:polysaccharide export outer membrane protein